jgi:DNA primase
VSSPTDDVARIRQASDLVAIASEIVALKRRGRLYWGLCPFHAEKTPSFKIDPATGLYYCFGCHEGGDVIRFVEKTKGLEFPEALEYLADRAGIALAPRATSRPRSAASGRRSIHEALSLAQDFYHRYLLESGTSEARRARDYLARRGIGDTEIAKFRLGLSPSSLDELSRHLRSKGLPEQAILESGLASRNERGRLIDFFRGRLMFPIWDPGGRPIAFGGRLVDESATDQPKYRNSPNTRVYNKSEALYAFHLARKAIIESGSVLVVEGYTDVIALHSVGFNNTVAACGTALTSTHVQALCRYAVPTAGPGHFLRLVLVFDGDSAGRAAAERAIEEIWGSGKTDVLDVRIAVLPEGSDPADLARSDADKLRAAIEEAEPGARFLMQTTVAAFSLETLEARVAAARAALKRLSLLPDPVIRRGYHAELAQLVGISESDVRELASRLETGVINKQRSPRSYDGGVFKNLGNAAISTQAASGRPERSSRSSGPKGSSPAAGGVSPKSGNVGPAVSGPGDLTAAGRDSAISDRASGGPPISGERGSGSAGRSMDTSEAGSLTGSGGEPLTGAQSRGPVSLPGAQSGGAVPLPGAQSRQPVPPKDLEKLQLLVHGSSESKTALMQLALDRVLGSEAARRAATALVRAGGVLDAAIEELRNDGPCLSLISFVASSPPELPEEDRKRWERGVIDDARRKILELEAKEALDRGDLARFQEIKRELKGVR